MASSNGESDLIDSVTLYDKDEKPTLGSIHYESGAVKEIVVKVGGVLKRNWGFYEDGALRFATVSVKTSGRTTEEVRQYYDQQGKPTRKETRVGHS